MGCTDSKLDRLPAVSLCRDRCRSLDDVLRLSYDLENAHVTYLHSLRAFGGSLNRFVSARAAPVSPGLDREEVQKQPLQPMSSASLVRTLSSDSGCHVPFDLDSGNHDGHGEGYYHPFEPPISYEKSQSAQYSTYVQPIYDTYPNQGITIGSGSIPPPPSPPPPSNSSWDFLNFFEAYGGYEQPSGTSRRRLKVSNSDEEAMTIKRETRIPTVAVPTKTDAPESETGKNRAKIPVAKSEESFFFQAEKWKSEDLVEVMKEVDSLFGKASDSGLAVLRSLNHAKSHYQQHRFSVYQVSSMVLHIIVPFQSKPALKEEMDASSSDKVDPKEEVKLVGSKNFSSTLKKLQMWEKKLYAEVKDEEKLRAIYSRKCKELRKMIENEKEGDANRIGSHRMLIKNLSTQLKISLHVVDAVTGRISRLRDDELWPCLCQLLLGWLEMWKVMEVCHRRQHEEIAKAKVVVTSLTDRKLDYGFKHLEEMMQVKLDLQNFALCFCKWAIAQKTCVGALHGWLTKCLSNEPEGRLHPSPPAETGALPPVFRVSSLWANSLDSSRTMPVIEMVTELVGTVGRIYDEDYVRLQAASEDKELERKTKALEKRDERMRNKIRRAIRRGVIPIPQSGSGSDGMEEGALGGTSNVGPRLEGMFEAMAKYAEYCVETYEELCKSCGGNGF